jgi:hypothetical protein
MLSGDAAEGEDSSEREEGRPTLSQPSGATLSQPSGITLSQPSGITLSQPSGITLSQPSGTQSPLTQPSDSQSPSCLHEDAVASPAPALAPMPLFTGQHKGYLYALKQKGTVRLLPTREGKLESVVSMPSEVGTSQLAQTTTQNDESKRPSLADNMRKAREAWLEDAIEQQRNGTWDSVPHGWHKDADGIRIRRNADVNAAVAPVNYERLSSDEDNPQLFMLESPKKVKPNSEDEGLGEKLDVAAAQ